MLEDMLIVDGGEDMVLKDRCEPCSLWHGCQVMSFVRMSALCW